MTSVLVTVVPSELLSRNTTAVPGDAWVSVTV
jgi:hypothetical protein